MRSIRGIIIAGVIFVVVLVLAIAIGAFWLNSFIHSPAFKSEVESRASETLGGPVQIDSVDFDIFHGVKLKGFVTQIDPAHDGGQGALKIQVESVNCGYAWTELFQRKLRITGVTLDKPVIVLTKQPTARRTTEAPAPSASTPSGPLTGDASGSATGSLPFQFVLDRIKISSGSVTVLDANGGPVVNLQDLNAEANTSGYYDGKDVTGKISVATATAPSNMQVKDFSTPVTYRGGAIEAKPFEASAFGGKIAGSYELGSAGPSILDLNANGLDVAQLTAATVSSSSAKLTGSLDLQSKWRAIESGNLNGEGDAQMANGKLEGVKILQEVSSALKIKELNDPVISKAQTHFVIQNRETKFIGLQLDSTIFRITGNGVIAFDGRLKADLVLILNRDAMARLPKELAASFVQQQDGTGSISFQVTGTTSNPQTDLPMRLLMQNTQIKKAINRALDKFFH
jgi:uncharacterized protein involved in outer membrane biogenesis